MVLEEFVIIKSKEYVERMEDVGIDVRDEFELDDKAQEALKEFLQDHHSNKKEFNKLT